MAAGGTKPSSRKQAIAQALCKHLSIDQNAHGATFGDGGEVDVRSLYRSSLESAGKWSPDKENDQVIKWVDFSESFLGDSQASFDVLRELNEDLSTKSVLLGHGLKLSEVDVIVFAAIYSSVIGLSDSEKEKLPNVMRWMDYVQNKEDFGTLFDKILVEKPVFGNPWHLLKGVAKPEVDTNAKSTSESTKSAEKLGADQNTKKSDAGKKAVGNKESTQEKTKAPEIEAVDKDKELSVSLLNIQVGLIRKAWKHPSADSLLVEEIDVGDAKLRQVVSGLAKYCSPEELTNRRVVLITNVKPGKLRDVMSEGLVLCASNGDHTMVEPLLPPEGAKIGERVSFLGIDGKPEDVLNPKKKQLEKITPNLFTDDKGVATFKGIPFMTSGGPCTSSIPKASIK